MDRQNIPAGKTSQTCPSPSLNYSNQLLNSRAFFFARRGLVARVGLALMCLLAFIGVAHGQGFAFAITAPLGSFMVPTILPKPCPCATPIKASRHISATPTRATSPRRAKEKAREFRSWFE